MLIAAAPHTIDCRLATAASSRQETGTGEVYWPSAHPEYCTMGINSFFYVPSANEIAAELRRLKVRLDLTNTQVIVMIPQMAV
jgi:hypothetical protein